MAPLVALSGFMGSGKSSVGAKVARLLDWRFIDLDEELSRAENVSVAEFFERHGESAFRLRELELLSDLLYEHQERGEGLVLSLGGGTLQSVEAAGMLGEQGGVVFLDVDVDRAWVRSQGGARPLARDFEAFAQLLESRRSTYRSTADWIIPVGDHTAEEIAAEIAGLVRGIGGAWPKSWGLRLANTVRPSTVMGGRGSLAVLEHLGTEAAAKGSRMFVITDENVHRAWGQAVVGRLVASQGPRETLVLEPGEASKTVGGLERCWDWLASSGARRDDIVVALGGGVVGDLAGFAAATYQRGLGLWQIPTSLLAQVDSSVGGKTGVNLESGKNLVGVFYQPDLVVVDPDTLTTLPSEEFVAGLGEVVKYGLLSGAPLFDSLYDGRGALGERERGFLSEVVKTCVRYKAAVVQEDERDTGRRAVLNLGHTTAHALEVSLGFGRLRHGEAVSLGLLVALAVSERALGLDPGVRERTRVLLADLGLPTTIALPSTSLIQAASARDKKVTARSSGFVGLRSVGEPVWGMDVDEDVFLDALETIRA
jgi:shikimate kinase/3-dehydroquinate synthase